MPGMKRKKWSELPGPAKAMTAFWAVIQFGLLFAALNDLRRRPANQVNGSKLLWAAACFINYVGPLAYFAKGRKQLPATPKPAAPEQDAS